MTSGPKPNPVIAAIAAEHGLTHQVVRRNRLHLMKEEARAVMIGQIKWYIARKKKS